MKQFTTHVKNVYGSLRHTTPPPPPPPPQHPNTQTPTTILPPPLYKHWPLLFFQLIGNKLKGMLPFNKSCFVWLGLTIITCAHVATVAMFCVCDHNNNKNNNNNHDNNNSNRSCIGRHCQWCWQLRESDHRSIRYWAKNINSPRTFCPRKGRLVQLVGAVAVRDWGYGGAELYKLRLLFESVCKFCACFLAKPKKKGTTK